MRDTAFPTCSYTPYGYSQPRKSQLGFNGEYQEALTGVYQLGNGYRTYSPSLMRFHSPDALSPFGEGGANPYGFCLCDPINLTDPSGRAPALIAQVKGWFKPGKKLVADTWDLTEKSLFPRRSQSEQGFIEGRYVINEYVKKLSSGTPFIDKLAAVNNNLASHGDGSLSRDHADAYVRIAQRTKSGSISNTSAHVLASQEWMKEQGPTRVVGTFFNLGGALGAGVEDHVLMKTGKSLHVTGNGIRNGIDL
ncbi:RHS repeat-associated core domain-containing protein [Pseudomonas sp. 51_B]|uniref:RHS repeat-associated core domain-containing protein n=1 Tax=Pseudomonas sp. 51_B TaxID=2813573 RepID=UPI001A9F94BD|nr:RHS repeat-associated core domain-containing protein [Pseudomonas sp. 51_B]